MGGQVLGVVSKATNHDLCLNAPHRRQHLDAQRYQTDRTLAEVLSVACYPLDDLSSLQYIVHTGAVILGTASNSAGSVS